MIADADMKCVLVVEDEGLIAEMLSEFIEDIGMRMCAVAMTAEQAIEMAQTYKPSVVLMDVRLKGGSDGITAGTAIERAVGSQIIYITGSSEPETIDRIRRSPTARVLFKPIALTQLQRLLEEVAGGART
jgi:response regulator of citrate/malate metabolism